MASLIEFGRRMDVIAEGVAVNTDKLVRTVALVADQALASGTPVDTGRARSNWIAQIGAAASDVIPAYDPGKDGATAAANTQAAMAQAETVIAGYKGDSDTEIHLTNNLPYIGRLNDGYSHQAAANFVEDSIQEAVRKVRSARIIKPPLVG